MQSVIAGAVSTGYLFVPSLDVCPPVQEHLDSLQMAFVSSPVESGGPILSKTQRQNYFIQIQGIVLHSLTYIHLYTQNVHAYRYAITLFWGYIHTYIHTYIHSFIQTNVHANKLTVHTDIQMLNSRQANINPICIHRYIYMHSNMQ